MASTSRSHSLKQQILEVLNFLDVRTLNLVIAYFFSGLLEADGA